MRLVPDGTGEAEHHARRRPVAVRNLHRLHDAAVREDPHPYRGRVGLPLQRPAVHVRGVGQAAPLPDLRDRARAYPGGRAAVTFR